MNEAWNLNLVRFIDLQPAGAGEPTVREAMIALLESYSSGSGTGIDSALAQLVGILSKPVDEIRGEFDRFCKLATPPPTNYAKFRRSYVGSLQHLRYGHLIGEVTGLSPVFGALLSPDGGLVGPGSLSKHITGGILGYHAIPHDGGGYLCRQHNIGPGYEYIRDSHTRSRENCEQNPFKGQVSGIVFWWRTLNPGFVRFLASAEPTAEIAAAEVGLYLGPGEFAASAQWAEALASETEPPDGVILNQAELLFLRALLGIEEEVAGDEELATGYDSLVNRGLIEEQEDGTYTVNDELIVMTAVASRPQTVVTVIAAAAEPGTEAAAEAAAVVETIVAAGDPANAPTPPGRSAYRYFEWEDAIVELTYPDADHVRLAGLSDRRQQVNRLQSIFGIDPSEVVIAGEQADLEQLEADAIDAWSRGTQIGEIRVERFEDDKLLDRQDYQIVPVEKMAWLINGKPDQPGSTLASPVTSRVLTEVVDTGLFPE